MRPRANAPAAPCSLRRPSSLRCWKSSGQTAAGPGALASAQVSLAQGRNGPRCQGRIPGLWQELPQPCTGGRHTRPPAAQSRSGTSRVGDSASAGLAHGSGVRAGLFQRTVAPLAPRGLCSCPRCGPKGGMPGQAGRRGATCSGWQSGGSPPWQEPGSSVLNSTGQGQSLGGFTPRCPCVCGSWPPKSASLASWSVHLPRRLPGTPFLQCHPAPIRTELALVPSFS